MGSVQNRDYLKESLIELRKPVRVLLIDDSIFTAHGLRTVLSRKRDMVVVSAVSTESEAFAVLRTCRPDVVVLDVRVGEASGIALCRTIQGSYPNTAVLFFTVCEDRNVLRAAILAGAKGYLLKNASSDSITAGIELVSAGKAIIDRQLTHHVLTWIRQGGGAGSRHVLKGCSNDDLTILSRVAAGKTNKEIAKELNIALSAVTTRLQKLYKRVKISRRSEAAGYFARMERDFVYQQEALSLGVR